MVEVVAVRRWGGQDRASDPIDAEGLVHVGGGLSSDGSAGTLVAFSGPGGQTLLASVVRAGIRRWDAATGAALGGYQNSYGGAGCRVAVAGAARLGGARGAPPPGAGGGGGGRAGGRGGGGGGRAAAGGGGRPGNGPPLGRGHRQPGRPAVAGPP